MTVLQAPAWKHRELQFSSIPEEVRVNFICHSYCQNSWHAVDYCFSKLREFFHSLHVLTVISIARTRKPVLFPSDFSYLFYCWSDGELLEPHINFCI